MVGSHQHDFALMVSSTTGGVLVNARMYFVAAADGILSHPGNIIFRSWREAGCRLSGWRTAALPARLRGIRSSVQ